MMDQQEDLQEQRETWKGAMDLPIQVCGVFFALDVIFLQNLTQGSGLLGWRTCALLFFVVALPCLAGNAFIMYQMRLKKTALPGKSRLFFVIQLVGYSASIAGVWANIMDSSWWIGLVFIAVVIIVTLLCSKLYTDIEHIRVQQK